MKTIKDGVELVAGTVSAGTVDTASIANGSIIAEDIASDAITTVKILNSNVTTTKIADANVTPAKTNIVQAVTATTDGTTTGTILDTTTHATVTSSAANKQIILPTPTPGRMLVIDIGANGCDMESNAPTTVLINGGAGGAGVKSAIAANSTCLMICVSATSWKGFFLDADSDVAKVAAAA